MPKKKDLQDEFTLTLRKPITLGEGVDAETYTKLDLREPEAEEVLDFNRRSTKDAGDALKRLIAKVSGAPLAVVAKMKARDFMEASAYLAAFMEEEGDDDTSGDSEGSLGK
jgi:hypothetical protein